MRLCSSAHISCGFPMFGIVLLAWEEKLVRCLGGLRCWVVAWCFDSGKLQWNPSSHREVLMALAFCYKDGEVAVGSVAGRWMNQAQASPTVDVDDGEL